MKVNWSLLGSIATFLAGAAGSTLVPVLGTHLATDVQAVLQTVSGVLTLIGGGAVTYTAVKVSHVKTLVKLGVNPSDAAKAVFGS